MPCLQVHDRLAALLPGGHQPPPFQAYAAAMIRGWLTHAVLRRSWSDIGRRNGLAVQTDNVHLTEPAAAAIADLIAGFLTQADRGEAADSADLRTQVPDTTAQRPITRGPRW